MKRTVTQLGSVLLLALGLTAAPRSQAAVIYAMDSKLTLWQLDTAGNAGAGSWIHYSMTGSVMTFTHGIDVDAAGNVYAANSGTYGANAISKIVLSGTTATVSRFSTGPASTNTPWDVVVSGSYLYVSDASNKRVVRCNLDGTGGGTVVGGTLAAATRGLAVINHDVYVDSGSSVYQILNADSATPGTATVFATSTSALSGLATDGTDFYATNGATLLLKGTTALSTLATHAASGLQAVAYSSDGNLFVVDANQANIYEYNATTGALVHTFSPGSGQTFYGIAVVPEPAMLTLLALGSVLFLRRSRKQ